MKTWKQYTNFKSLVPLVAGNVPLQMERTQYSSITNRAEPWGIWSATGTLNIDVLNYTFHNCPNLLFGPGATIKILSTNTLTINNSTLKAGCGQMWQGIELADDESTVDINTSSWIQDAIIAVNAPNRGMVKIKNSTFDRNEKHVFIDDMNLGTTLYDGYIHSSKFDCSAALLSGGITSDAITIKNFSGGIQIGDDFGPAYKNEIKNFSTTGIKIERSNAWVVNNKIKENGVYPQTATGIHATGNNHSQAPNELYVGWNATNSFTQYSYNTMNYMLNGVVAEINYSLFVEEFNLFQNIGLTGILFTECAGIVHIDKENRFINCRTGIFGNDNPQVDKIIITRNNFQLTEKETAIKVWEASGFNNPASHCLIEDNDIDGARWGIFVKQRPNAIIHFNHINHTLPIGNPPYGNAFGIRVTNAVAPQVIDNVIISTAGINATNKYWAINIIGGSDAIVCGNYTAAYDRGIWFNQSNAGAIIKTNIMYQNEQAFAMTNGCTIGPQGDDTHPTENRWIENNIDSYAASSNLVSPFTNFYTWTDVCGISPNHYKICYPISSGLLVETIFITGTNNPEEPTCEVMVDFFGSNNQKAIQQIEGSDSIVNSEEQWFTKKSIYEWIKAEADSTIDTSNIDIAAFLNAMAVQPIGKFYDVSRLLSVASADTTTFVFDSLKLVLAKLVNESIAVTHAIDGHKKNMNNIYLSTIARGIYSFSQGQKDSIINVASLCAYEFGPGVFQARVLLAMFDTIEFEDDCGEEVYYRKEQSSVFNSNDYKIYPNPTDATFTLEYIVPEGSIAKFELADLTGRVLNSELLDEKKTKQLFSCDHYVSGLYFYSIIIDGIKVKSNKLVIIK